jgi:hypothetical protein
VSLPERIPDLETFLAYSIALEEEAAERHDELADVLEVHNNPEVGGVFRKLAEYSRLHAGEVRELSLGRKLPRIAPWDFGWENLEGPETIEPGDVDYLITTRRALQVAMNNERSAHDFYQALAEAGATEEIRRTATEFAEEELEHLELLREWLARIPEEDEVPPFDPDPPHMPE